MIIDKITVGFVVQKYDTESGKYIEQDFIAEDDVTYENEFGERILADESPVKFSDIPYLPFDMVQPE